MIEKNKMKTKLAKLAKYARGGSFLVATTTRNAINLRMKQVCAIGMILSLGIMVGLGAEEKLDLDKIVAQPAELSAWAYSYRANLKAQEKPEAYFILRRLQRLDQVYRPVNLLLSQDKSRPSSFMLPAPSGVLQSALLWEGRVQLNRVELDWPKEGPAPPPPESVEVRVYPAPFGWFGWQADEQVTVSPKISQDGLTWVYQATELGDRIPTTKFPSPNVGISWGGTGATAGFVNSNEMDMVAVFIEPRSKASKEGAKEQTECAVPQIRAYGPEKWKRMDVEIEWGFKEGTETADFDGRIDGFFGHVAGAAPLAGDPGTTMEGENAWKSRGVGGNRRGVSLSLLYIEPEMEYVSKWPRFPYGNPDDTRITVWTKSGSFSFLVRDLKKGPILAPEHGFFVVQAGTGETAREFTAQLAARNVRSIREMTREHSEATWEEATREITLPLFPPGTTLPPYKQEPEPPMQVQLPEKRWTDAWRMGAWQMKQGELSYMPLALEASRPILAMDMVGLHDTASKWLDTFLERPGTPSDGDFSDGSGNFCLGKLFHETAIASPPYGPLPKGYDTYELIHNGGSGKILYDLAEHYFLTGDTNWFKKNEWRMQAAAEWIIRQRNLYMKDVANRADLWVAGLHPPQHIADCAWGQSEWKWYANIDAWYYQGLHRFAEAMAEVDSINAGRYFEESDQYQKALKKAVDRAITLAPVMQVRNGTYRSFIPPIFYIRGPSIGQVTQISMTDNDWPLELVDAAGIPAADDIRLDGHLDVCEDVMSLASTYLHGGHRFEFLTEKRSERGLHSADDWFWGGASPQLGYSYLANVYLRRDEVPSFLRQWVNNYASFVMPTPEYHFTEHFMNHEGTRMADALKKGDYGAYINGHALSYFMEQFRSLLVWEDGDTLWLAKATPRRWLEQGEKISVKNAPTCFGDVGYEIASDADNGLISATVELPCRKPPKAVLLRFRHPKGLPMKTATVNGASWTDIDPMREVVRLHDVKGTVKVEASY
jgi:hypothetical protein